MTCTWFSPASSCGPISICSTKASPGNSTSPTRGRRAPAVARALNGGKVELGAIHTYIELFARYFMDLTPQVAMTVARAADRDGNLYMGPNVEDSPAVVEATAFKQGIVVAQVNAVLDKLPRVDVPGDRIDLLVETPNPFYVEPLFTRDPAQVTETQILTAMMAIKGIYAPYGIKRLNHGIGFNAAAIELLLPTSAESLGLRIRLYMARAISMRRRLQPPVGWCAVSGMATIQPERRYQ